MRGAGRSFALLVGVGACLEFAGGILAVLGLDTLGQCYWDWLPDNGVQSSVCETAIPGAGFHLFIPVVLLVAVLLTTVVLAALSILSLLRGVCRLDSLLGPALQVVPPSVSAAASKAQALLVEVRSHDLPYALCTGILRPRSIVSLGLVRLLTEEELVAVLAHEERHRRRHAPLRHLVARTTAAALFFLPLLGDVLEAHLLQEEIVADREAVALAGRRSLVQALQKLSTAVNSAEGVAAFAAASMMSGRLDALEGSACPSPIGRVRAAVSIGSMVVLALLVSWMPVAAFH